MSDIPDSLPESVFLPNSPAQVSSVPLKKNAPKKNTFSKVFLTVQDFSATQHSKYCKCLKFARENPEIFATIVQVIEGKHRVSKRILEHLVTNFAKNRHLILVHHGEPYDVYQHYQLNRAKKMMDTSRRGPRILFPFQGREVETTFEQLEGMRWYMSTPIFQYAEKEYDMIKKHLNELKQITTKKSTDHIKISPIYNQHYALDIFPIS